MALATRASPLTSPGKCYQNAGPETEIHHELTTPTGSLPLWKQVAARSQQEFSSKLSLDCQNFLGEASPNLPPPDQKDVRNWPLSSGDLDSTDIDITESSLGRILSLIANQTWSAEQVTRSFVKRAIIAQHLTNPISDMFF